MAEGKQDSDSGGRRKSLIWLVILVGVAAVSVGAGLGIGSVLRPGPQRAQAEQPPPPDELPGATDPAGGISREDYTYYEFEPITANADERGMTRYIRATIILAIPTQTESRIEATKLLDKKKPELTSWLNIFLHGRTLEEVRGVKNLNRLRREIRDAFNEQLWPNRAPVVDNVLFKDFAVQ